ncbi:hypothetical protein [Xenorhabdus bovienii]|nr:hypothetical protein [Xenorhabdus bovienii]
MSKTNGVLFNNYISAAPSTVLSLTNSFSLREYNKLEVNNNIVSLAKKVDIILIGFQIREC